MTKREFRKALVAKGLTVSPKHVYRGKGGRLLALCAGGNRRKASAWEYRPA